MAENESKPLYNLGPDDKLAQVMIYTTTSLYWGDIIVKQLVRVSTWLKTNTAPDRICMHNAHGLLTTSSSPKSTTYSELHVATSQIIAYHLIPPAKDPIDYDPTEPNRHLEPVNALVGSFLIKAHLRISDRANLAKFLEVARENYTSLYDCEIINLALPTMGAMTVPYILVRQEQTVFANR
jgi:hypothetical protein